MARHYTDLQNLIEWLEKKPAEGTYDFIDTRGCLLFQYLKAQGLPIESVGTTCWVDTTIIMHKDLPQSFVTVSSGVGWDDPRTFGAALDRARALVKEPA